MAFRILQLASSFKMAEDQKSDYIGSPHTSGQLNAKSFVMTESNDADFNMNADMMVHDIDDERTIEEEEMMESGEEFSNEVNNLQKEGDMPIEDLLALYGYDGDGEHNEVPLEEIRPQPLHPFSPQKVPTMPERETVRMEREEDTQSISSEGSLSRASTAQSSNSREEQGYNPFQNQRITRGIASLHAHYFENDDTSDDEYQPLADEWRKDVAIGPDFQADVPEFMQANRDTSTAFEHEDKLLWKPDVIDTKQLKKYLNLIFSSPEGEMGTSFRDDEQALYLLLQSGNVEEALIKKGEQSKLPPDVSLWSEEECRNFELGLRIYGKDFRQIQRNKISHRNVGDIVQFYYLWKKTERYDAFCSQTRFGKKKYGAPGIADYMDRFMDEAESVVSSRSASPYSQNVIGNSSPAEVPMTIDRPNQPVSTPLATQSNTSTLNTISATGTQQSVDATALQSTFNPSTEVQLSINRTDQSNPYTTGSHTQVIGSFVPDTMSLAKPQQADMNISTASLTTKAPALDLFSSTVSTFGGTKINEMNHFSSAVHPVNNQEAETLMVRGIDSWNHHESKIPLLDTAGFVSSNQPVYRINPTTSVNFGPAGFTTTSIGQPVE